MPRTTAVSDADLQWLRQAHARRASYHEMSRHLHCCVDTVKRILQKHQIAEFDAAKYIAVAPAPLKWSRPCMNCGDTTPRPKNLYLCDRCRKEL